MTNWQGAPEPEELEQRRERDRERQKLEPGMFLFVPAGTDSMAPVGRPKLWCVKSASERSAKLIAHYGSIQAEATLTKGYLPDGWRIVRHDVLASAVEKWGASL